MAIVAHPAYPRCLEITDPVILSAMETTGWTIIGQSIRLPVEPNPHSDLGSMDLDSLFLQHLIDNPPPSTAPHQHIPGNISYAPNDTVAAMAGASPAPSPISTNNPNTFRSFIQKTMNTA